jgi:hypothetical protein
LCTSFWKNKELREPRAKIQEPRWFNDIMMGTFIKYAELSSLSVLDTDRNNGCFLQANLSNFTVINLSIFHPPMS